MDTSKYLREFQEGYKNLDFKSHVDAYLKDTGRNEYSFELDFNVPKAVVASLDADYLLAESPTKCNLESLSGQFFQIPITMDFDEDHLIPYYGKNSVQWKHIFIKIAIVYLRKLLKHNIGFNTKVNMGNIFKTENLDEIDFISVSFDFKHNTINLMGAYKKPKGLISENIGRILDPRLLLALMVKMSNSHEGLTDLGYDLASLEDNDNHLVFSKLFQEYLENKHFYDKSGEQAMVYGKFNELDDETRKYMGQPQPDIAEQKAEYASQVALKEQLGQQKPTPDLISKLEQNQDTPQPLVPKGGIGKAHMQNVRSGYQSLASVLEKALDQAQNGKGNERHQVGGAIFEKQPICELGRLYGTGYNFGQAAKKAHETNQLDTKQAKLNELYGAINYLAAAAILIEEGEY